MVTRGDIYHDQIGLLAQLGHVTPPTWARQGRPAVAVRVGDPAPEVALPDHQGRTWRLSDHRGRPVVLLFHRHLA